MLFLLSCLISRALFLQSHQQEKDVRLKAMEEANMKEDKMIKQLEKQLKMNKRKSKNLPQMFAVEGLDCILHQCRPKQIWSTLSGPICLL